MESLTLQALRIDWYKEDDFDEDYQRTTNYVKGLIGKSWWISKGQLLSNEGPLSRMTEVCMVYQLEARDRENGYAAYTKYLTDEYGGGITRNRMAVRSRLREESTVPVPFAAQTHVEENGVELPTWLTDEQADFLVMYSKMGMDQVAEMLGITMEKAWNYRRMIQNKRRYWAAKE